MGLTEGWYIVRYKEGEEVKALSGFCTEVRPFGWEPYLKVEYAGVDGKKWAKLIRVELIETMEEIGESAVAVANMAEVRIKTAPADGIEKPTEEEEAAAKEFFSRSLNNEQILPVGAPSKEEQPETEEQLARDFRKVCKWCHHSQAWHPPVGSSAECQYPDCHCPVLRGDPVFREAEVKEPPNVELGKEAPHAILEMGEVRITLVDEEPQSEQKPAATEQDKFDVYLNDALAKLADALGIDPQAMKERLPGGYSRSREFLIRTQEEKKQNQAAMSDFERILGEVRADVLRGALDEREQRTVTFGPAIEASPQPTFRTCIDCGDPWAWHGDEPGQYCGAFQCRCTNIQKNAECFIVPPEETP